MRPPSQANNKQIKCVVLFKNKEDPQECFCLVNQQPRFVVDMRGCSSCLFSFSVSSLEYLIHFYISAASVKSSCILQMLLIWLGSLPPPLLLKGSPSISAPLIWKPEGSSGSHRYNCTWEYSTQETYQAQGQILKVTCGTRDQSQGSKL